MSKRQLLSINMRRRNAAMHSLLETNTEDDVLFVQEPWFDRIGVERSDHAREGWTCTEELTTRTGSFSTRTLLTIRELR
jgi:hypothetical protein